MELQLDSMHQRLGDRYAEGLLMIIMLNIPPRWPTGTASASRAGDTGFAPRLSWSNHTRDLETDTLAADRPAWGVAL